MLRDYKYHEEVPYSFIVEAITKSNAFKIEYFQLIDSSKKREKIFDRLDTVSSDVASVVDKIPGYRALWQEFESLVTKVNSYNFSMEFFYDQVYNNLFSEKNIYEVSIILNEALSKKTITLSEHLKLSWLLRELMICKDEIESFAKTEMHLIETYDDVLARRNPAWLIALSNMVKNSDLTDCVDDVVKKHIKRNPESRILNKFYRELTNANSLKDYMHVINKYHSTLPAELQKVLSKDEMFELINEYVDEIPKPLPQFKMPDYLIRESKSEITQIARIKQIDKFYEEYTQQCKATAQFESYDSDRLAVEEGFEFLLDYLESTKLEEDQFLDPNQLFRLLSIAVADHTKHKEKVIDKGLSWINDVLRLIVAKNQRGDMSYVVKAALNMLLHLTDPDFSIDVSTKAVSGRITGYSGTSQKMHLTKPLPSGFWHHLDTCVEQIYTGYKERYIDKTPVVLLNKVSRKAEDYMSRLLELVLNPPGSSFLSCLTGCVTEVNEMSEENIKKVELLLMRFVAIDYLIERIHSKEALSGPQLVSEMTKKFGNIIFESAGHKYTHEGSLLKIVRSINIKPSAAAVADAKKCQPRTEKLYSDGHHLFKTKLAPAAEHKAAAARQDFKIR